MVQPARHKTQLKFRGSPLGLECIAPVERTSISTGMVAIDLGGAIGQLKANLHMLKLPGSASARLRFALPALTPAGTYEGTAKVDANEFPIVAKVEPRVHLVLSPNHLALEAFAKAEVTAELTLLNDGNVTCEIGKAQVFRLFDLDGFNRGLAAALSNDGAKGRERIERFVEALADSHGGMVRVMVHEGAGTIRPGEHRELSLAFRFSDRLANGRTYYGYLSLYNLHYHVQVRASARHTS
jgi:hypothetical protein